MIIFVNRLIIMDKKYNKVKTNTQTPKNDVCKIALNTYIEKIGCNHNKFTKHRQSRYSLLFNKISLATKHHCHCFEDDSIIKIIESPANESRKALQKGISVTFVEGNDIFTIYKNKKQIKIKEIDPLVKITFKSITIHK